MCQTRNGRGASGFFIALDDGFPLLVNPRVKVAAKWRPMLTAEDTVLAHRRIATERASVDERGAFGIQPEPAVGIVGRCGGQTRRAPGAQADEKVGECWDRRYTSS